MFITIENPTAEAIFEALQSVPDKELARLQTMLSQRTSVVDESSEWSEEDLEDFSRAGAALYEEIEAQEVKLAQTR